MHTNHTNDGQVSQIDPFRNDITQSAQILTIGFIDDNPIIIQKATNKGQSMKQPPMILVALIMALKMKFEFKTTKSTTKASFG